MLVVNYVRDAQQAHFCESATVNDLYFSSLRANVITSRNKCSYVYEASMNVYTAINDAHTRCALHRAFSRETREKEEKTERERRERAFSSANFEETYCTWLDGCI